MKTTILLPLIIISFITGCGKNAEDLLPSELDSVTGIDGLVTYDGEAEVTAINQDNFTLKGDCNVEGETVTLSGSIIGSAICASGEWSVDMDLTYLPDGNYVVGARFGNGESIFQILKNLSAGPIPPAAVANPLDIGVEARYDFSDAGNLGNDSVSTHHATSFSNITSEVDAEKGTVLSFNGTSSYFELSDGSYFNHSFDQRTVSFSFKTADVFKNQALYEEGGSTNGLVIFLDDGYLFASVRAGGTSTQMNLIVDASTFENKWNDIAVTFYKGEFKLYVNNEAPISRTTSYQTIPNHSDTGGIGKRYNSDAAGGSGHSHFEGKMSRISIYERALNSLEVTKLIQE